MTPEAVFADQRRRLRRATIELVAQGGVKGLTVRGLSQRAGVSTRTFYRQFANVADCIGFASESTMQSAVRRMEEASLSSPDAAEAVEAAITALLLYLADNEEAASVALIEAFDAGPPVVGRLQTTTRTLEQTLDALLSAPTGAAPLPRRLLIGMRAGVLHIARATFLVGRANELPSIAPGLSGWLISLASPTGDRSLRAARVRPAPSPRREADPLPDGRGYDEGGAPGEDRQRILRAAVRLAVADGFASLTVPRIRRIAEVSRRSFDSQFRTVSECFLAALEWLAGVAAARARTWAVSEKDWELRVRRLMTALAAQAARNEGLAELLLVRVLEPGMEGLLCREGLLTEAVAVIRSELAPRSLHGDIGLNASLAAAWEIAAEEVVAGRSSELPGLSAVLTALILGSNRPPGCLGPAR